jgi:hypothetical protein
LDGDNTYVSDTLTHDSAGNLTFDGVQKYTYDVWNRQIKVYKAYRNSGGTLTDGSEVSVSTCDGLGRARRWSTAKSGAAIARKPARRRNRS